MVSVFGCPDPGMLFELRKASKITHLRGFSTDSVLKPLILFCDWRGLIKVSSRWTRAFTTFQFYIIYWSWMLWSPGYKTHCFDYLLRPRESTALTNRQTEKLNFDTNYNKVICVKSAFMHSVIAKKSGWRERVFI
jgi:hypothetical protein